MEAKRITNKTPKVVDQLAWVKNLPSVGPAFYDRRLSRAAEIDAAILRHMAELKALKRDAKALVLDTERVAGVDWTAEEIAAAKNPDTDLSWLPNKGAGLDRKLKGGR